MSGTTVGTLSTVDPDAGDTHTYSLVSGAGSTDNASFTIVGTQLRTAAAFDYETKSSYSIRVRTTDSTTRTFEEQFTITVTNVNEAPTDIGLTSTSVAENQTAGTTVGTLSATDQDAGDTHTFSLVAGVGSTDNASFTIVGTSLRTNAVFNFEAKSSHSIRVRATDGGALTFEEALTITVTNVNEAPTDISLTTASIAENQASGTTVGTFSTTDVDAGDTHTYSLVSGTGSTDNASFTITGTSLKTAGAFDFETKSSYSIRVRTTDAGSLTFEEVFTISVTNVNEAPVNTVPSAQTVNEDTDLTFSSGTGNALSVADVDAGASAVKLSLDVADGTLTLASTAGLTFVDGTANGTASVHVTGTMANINTGLAGLKYKGTSNWNSSRGTETLTVVTNDQGNTGSGSAQSDTDTVGVSVTAVNDAPSAATKSYTVQANMKVVGLSGLLTGATDPDTGDGSYTASFTVNDVVVDPCAASSTISNLSTSAGTFDLDPPTGFSGTCTLKYRVNDSGNPGPAATSAYASITLTVSGPVIWFVNQGAAAGGTGRLSAPFNTLAAADAVDAGNHAIFLYSGTYATGITLNSGEKLLGQGTTGTTFDTFFGITPPTGTLARPALATGTANVQATVNLASTATLRGLVISTGTSAGLVGSGGLTGIDVAQVSVATSTGTAVNLNNAAGTYSFSTISTNGAANGILLDTLGASSFTVSLGAIVNASTRGVDINGGTGNFSYGGTISTSGSGRSVEITSHTGGAVTFSGAVSDTGIGINLGSNTGATINFTGGVAASTGANVAFNATGGGTVTVTGANNTLTATTATTLNVQNTTIGASGLTFKSISSSGGTSDGIVLDNTGSSGGLTVTGDGTNTSVGGNSTGGIIANKSGSDGSTTSGIGIYLNNTRSVTLRRMTINGTNQNFGIYGTNVTGATLEYSTVSGTNGTNLGADEGSIIFDGLLGTSAFTKVAVSGAVEDNFRVRNSSNTSSVTIDSSTFSNAPNDNIIFEPSGTATVTARVTNNTFTGAGGDHLQTATSNSATLNIVFTGNFFSNGFPSSLGGGVTISGGNLGSSEHVNFNISNNGSSGSPLVGTVQGGAININEGQGAGTWQGQVSNNFIGNAAVASSGCAQCTGIRVENHSTSGTLTAIVSGNTVKQWNNGPAINSQAGDAGNASNTGVLNVTVTNNTASNPGSLSQHGFVANIGAGTGGGTAANVACVDVRTNTLDGNTINGGSGVRTRQREVSTVRIPGYTGTQYDGTAVAAYLQTLNPASVGAPTAATSSAGPGYTNTSPAGSQCPQPTVPS